MNENSVFSYTLISEMYKKGRVSVGGISAFYRILPEKKAVFDICTKELLTPKGLRSLSPKSGGYNPMYVGPQEQTQQLFWKLSESYMKSMI